MRSYLKSILILLGQFFIYTNCAFAQHTIIHAKPIISNETDSVSFYDHLNKTLGYKKLNYTNTDSSFNWLIGEWTIHAKGYAKNGFRGKKVFEWNEPPVEFVCDENHSVFASYKDSTVFFTKNGSKKICLPPQVILQYDVYGKVWVLQAGYNNRYDWGSLIATGWEENKIVFYGTISLTGIKCNERQTWTKVSNNQFHILYEEKLQDNTWFIIEENIYTKAL